MTQTLQQTIESIKDPSEIASHKSAILETINHLDRGDLRVAEKMDGQWKVNAWVKQAILFYFQLQTNEVIPDAFTNYFDKIPLKYGNYSRENFLADKVRVVPPACARKGAFIAPHCV